jgi:hypothetical protein
LSNSVTLAAPGQVLTTSGTNPWMFNGSTVNTIDFGAPGETGTVVWGTNPGSTSNGSSYTVVVQASRARQVSRTHPGRRGVGGG